MTAPRANSLAPYVLAALRKGGSDAGGLIFRLAWVPALGKVSRVRVRHALEWLRACGLVRRFVREDGRVWWEVEPQKRDYPDWGVSHG